MQSTWQMFHFCIAQVLIKNGCLIVTFSHESSVEFMEGRKTNTEPFELKQLGH